MTSQQPRRPSQATESLRVSDQTRMQSHLNSSEKLAQAAGWTREALPEAMQAKTRSVVTKEPQRQDASIRKSFTENSNTASQRLHQGIIPLSRISSETVDKRQSRRRELLHALRNLSNEQSRSVDQHRSSRSFQKRPESVQLAQIMNVGSIIPDGWQRNATIAASSSSSQQDPLRSRANTIGASSLSAKDLSANKPLHQTGREINSRSKNHLNGTEVVQILEQEAPIPPPKDTPVPSSIKFDNISHTYHQEESKQSPKFATMTQHEDQNAVKPDMSRTCIRDRNESVGKGVVDVPRKGDFFDSGPTMQRTMSASVLELSSQVLLPSNMASQKKYITQKHKPYRGATTSPQSAGKLEKGSSSSNTSNVSNESNALTACASSDSLSSRAGRTIVVSRLSNDPNCSGTSTPLPPSRKVPRARVSSISGSAEKNKVDDQVGIISRENTSKKATASRSNDTYIEDKQCGPPDAAGALRPAPRRRSQTVDRRFKQSTSRSPPDTVCRASDRQPPNASLPSSVSPPVDFQSLQFEKLKLQHSAGSLGTCDTTISSTSSNGRNRHSSFSDSIFSSGASTGEEEDSGDCNLPCNSSVVGLEMQRQASPSTYSSSMDKDHIGNCSPSTFVSANSDLWGSCVTKTADTPSSVEKPSFSSFLQQVQLSRVDVSMPWLVRDKSHPISQAAQSQVSPSSVPLSTETPPFSSQVRSSIYLENPRRSEFEAKNSFNIGTEKAPNHTPTFGTVESFENLYYDHTKTSFLHRNASKLLHVPKESSMNRPGSASSVLSAPSTTVFDVAPLEVNERDFGSLTARDKASGSERQSKGKRFENPNSQVPQSVRLHPQSAGSGYAGTTFVREALADRTHPLGRSPSSIPQKGISRNRSASTSQAEMAGKTIQPKHRFTVQRHQTSRSISFNLASKLKPQQN